MADFSKDLIAASTIPFILSILSKGDDYGYSLIKKVNDISDGALNWKEGSLYPVLSKLESQGHIKSYYKVFNNRKRKYYSINKKGASRLKDLANQWRFINNTLNTLWKPII